MSLGVYLLPRLPSSSFGPLLPALRASHSTVFELASRRHCRYTLSDGWGQKSTGCGGGAKSHHCLLLLLRVVLMVVSPNQWVEIAAAARVVGRRLWRKDRSSNPVLVGGSCGRCICRY